ncbi:MAG: amidohydrolase family protein [Candidatus Binataceae bacterium]
MIRQLSQCLDTNTSRSLSTFAGPIGERVCRAYHRRPSRPLWRLRPPLPDVDEPLEEIAYALGTLKLDGVVLLVNFNGVYLGDQRLDPVFDELNRRGAVVFIHPISPICWQQSVLGYPHPMVEFPFDSTWVVVNLMFSGTAARCPKLRIIIGAGRQHAPHVFNDARQNPTLLLTCLWEFHFRSLLGLYGGRRPVFRCTGNPAS